MKKYYYCSIGTLVLCIVSAGLYYKKDVIFFHNLPSKKKKVLILTSSGGGGNLEASNAIKAYLDNDYNVQLCHLFKEILGPLDPFSRLTLHKYSSEEVYNFLMPGKHFKLLHWIYQFGRWYVQSHKERIVPLLRNYFVATQPDLIISVIPVVNNLILQVAQECNIPFLLLPTDLDRAVYTADIIHPTYEKFYIALMLDDAEIKTPLETNIAQDHIHLVGAPLRPDFLTQKNKTLLRKQYNIEENKPVIMMLMGSQGADEIQKYVERLLTIDQPYHLIICIGKNEKSSTNLAKLSFPAHISTSIVGFTPYISDYMALSDLLITKSGTLSVCEALYMNLPLFLDATSTLLPWEKFNHYFIKKHTLGLSLHNFDHVAPLITTIITHPDELNKYKKNSERLEKKNCSQELPKLVKKIIAK